MTPSEAAALDRRWNCRLTTTGRKSGEPRAVTIWFVLDGDSLYLTGGPDGPQWSRNLRANPECELRIGDRTLHGTARCVDDPGQAEAIRQRFVRKYLLARLARPFGGYTRSVALEVRVR